MQKPPCTDSWPHWVSRGALHTSWDTHRKLLASSHLKDTSIWAPVCATMLFKPATSLPGSPCHKEVRGTRPGVGPSGFNSVPAHQQLCDVRKFRKAPEPQSPLLSNGADDRTCLAGAAQPCGCLTLSQYLNNCLLRGGGEPEGSSSPPPSPRRAAGPAPPGRSTGSLHVISPVPSGSARQGHLWAAALIEPPEKEPP